MTATSPSMAPVVGINRTYQGCSSIRDYEMLGKLGEGTFGEVHKARGRKTGSIVALKKILMHNEKDGFPITALREIKLLKMLSHVNVLKLEEMAIERPKGEGRKRAVLYTVTPYMEHDLSGLLDNPDVRFTEPQIKCYMLQLLEGLRYLHDSHILHRDMKAANLLISNRGILQIADFGLARHYSERVPEPGKGGGEATQDYTALVVTRWYRPPELLLSLRKYTTAIDLWGAGCVFGEMFKRKPILAGNSDLNQANIIFDLIGSPTEENMPGWSSLPGCEGVKQFSYRKGNLEQVFREQGSGAISLLRDLLKLDWRKRINAIDALNHPYFKTDPKPARPEDLPTFQDSHELDRRRATKGAPPPAPAGVAVGMGPNGEHTGSGPPTHGIANNRAWVNSDRSRGGPDYGPPGLPPGGHRGHDNRPPPGHSGYDRHGGPRHGDNRQSGRGYDPPPRGSGYESHRGNSYAPPGNLNHPLPPRPGENSYQPPSNTNAYRPPASKTNKDTYVPAYLKDRRSEEGLEGPARDQRRGSHDSREGRPESRDSRGRREDHWRERDYRRKTRSRSPERNRREARDRERERDVYRR